LTFFSCVLTMKFFLLVAAVVCVATASLSDEFDAWAQKYGKTYADEAERAYRMNVFSANKAKIAMMNARGAKETYGLNSFADRTHAELTKSRTSKSLKVAMRRTNMPTVVAPAARKTLPDIFNWVEKGAVTSVKDQGDCGSCWSFGAVGTMEGQLFLKTGKLTNLSEQNLVDCDHVCQYFSGEKECDLGCDGGMEANAFQYVIDNGGINLLEDYPYTARDGTCKYDASKAVKGFNNWTFVIVEQEDDLRQYLYDNGPVSVGVHADEWFFYHKGIFDSSCERENDHAVLLTGWGEENGTPYWIIKNSWGDSWGMDGYIHLIRGKNKCGMLDLMTQIHMN